MIHLLKITKCKQAWYCIRKYQVTIFASFHLLEVM